MLLHIRPTEETDVDELSAMMIASWRDTYASIMSAAKLDEICSAWLTSEKFLARTRNEDALSFVAVVDGVIIGHLFAEISHFRNLNIAYFYVAKDFLRQGIGTQMLEQLIAGASGAKSLTLGVFSDNLAAVDFYTVQGFRAVGEDNAKDWQLGDPTGMKMEKLL